MAHGPWLEVRLTPARIVLITLALVLALVAPAGALAAPSGAAPSRLPALADESLASAEEAVREFSQLEEARDFDALYERMHPDARAIVPRSVVVGWYEAFLAGREADVATITGATPEPWTWGVTGETYDDAVTVTFTQPYTADGVTTETPGEVHVVSYDDDQWGWFFGASRAFLDEQLALYGDDGSATVESLAQGAGEEETPEEREALFPDPLHAHIDKYWAARFQEADRPYDPPNGVVPFDAPIVTACGRADPDEEAAFYCVIDEKIYYSSSFRALIERQIGDFAWVVVVAHEWGHHIQAQLGFDLGVVPDRAGEVAPVAYEQQADCMAGAYSQDAELTGWLDPGDIDEALFMTEISGDPPGTAWNDPGAHGSADQRVDAFLEGYANGLIGCNLDLSEAGNGG